MKTARIAFVVLCSAGWLGAANPPTPELGLDVNARTDAVVAKGWPLLIRVAVISADGQQLQVGLNSGSWTQALHLSVTDANGAAQNWPMQLSTQAPSTLSVSGYNNAEAVWLVSPSDTSAIPAGLYNLSVTLDTTSGASAGGWSGSVTGNGATVQFQAEPSTLAAEDEASKYLAIAAYARLRGDTSGARTALDTLIHNQPDSLEAYFEKAGLLEAAGDLDGALTLASDVLHTFLARNPDPPEPITILRFKVADLADKLAAQQAAGGGQVVTSVEPGSTATVVAPEAIVNAHGTRLATGTELASGSLPTTLAGTSVIIVDSGGASISAPLFYVSPGQVDYQLPASAAAGPATVHVKAGDATESTGLVTIAAVQPDLFTLNGAGLIAGSIQRVTTGGQRYEDLYTWDSAGNVIARPVDLSNGQVYLILYATGIRHAQAGQLSVTIGGMNATVSSAGPEGSVAGLDQVKVLVPASLAGHGDVPLLLTAAGKQSNTARITFK
jgi:uncharacterized protein (TIGR03437 family)